MDDIEKKFDFRRFVSPKAKNTYILRVVIYAVILFLLIVFIKYKLPQKEKMNDFNQEIQNINIELEDTK